MESKSEKSESHVPEPSVPLRAHVMGCSRALSVPVDLCACGGRYVQFGEPSVPAAPAETFWVLEKPGPVYWDGGHAESETKNIDAAIQWRRKQDTFPQHKHLAQWGWKIVEHGYIAVPAAPAFTPVCGEPTPDRSGRTCDKPKGHAGDHWTYGGHTLTWPAAPPAVAELIARVTKLARDIGTVRGVAARRSDGDKDHQQMLRRLDEWESEAWLVKEDAATLLSQHGEQLEALKKELATRVEPRSQVQPTGSTAAEAVRTVTD